MILIFKKGSKFTGPSKSGDKSSIFPIINLPVYDKGESVELNDFQWWSYTDKWEQWLKSNPRSWTAESEENEEDFSKILEELFLENDPYKQFFDFQLDKIVNENRVASFTEFSQIFEQEGGSTEGNKQSKESIKLGFAINKLVKDGTFKKEMNIDELEIGSDYAVVVDFIDEEGNPSTPSRQALKLRKFRETNNLVLASTNFSIPLGKIPDEPNDFIDKVSEFAGNVVKGAGVGVALYAAVTVAGQAFMIWALYKGSRKIYKKWGIVQSTNQALGRGNLWSKMKNFASTAFKGKGASSITNAARINLPTGSSIVGTQAFGKSGQLLNLPQTKFVARGAVKRGLISKTASRKLIQAAAARQAAKGGATAAASGSVAARATNPIGWILLAAQAVGSAAQQTYNWYSKKQAPRYSEVKNFAFGTFSPGKIPSGKPITICWTDDGGSGTWGGLLKAISFSKDDTRTTMDLVKLGNFKGRSVFVLLNVHSKSMGDVLKNNEIVMLSFDNNEEFKRGVLDNDDLSFGSIVIEDSSEFALASYFIGYSDWEKMEDSYREAPSSLFVVPEYAPENYSFNYSDKDDVRINVQGNLMSKDELDSISISDLLPIPGETVSVTESIFLESLDSNISIPFALNFEKFSSLKVDEQDDEEEIKPKSLISPSSEEKKKETETTEPADKKSETTEKEEEKSDWQKEFETLYKDKKAPAVSEYSQVPLAVYEVEGTEFVNPDEKGKLPEFKYFIVGLESLDAKDNEPIAVESTSDDAILEPRYGLEKFKPKEKSKEDTDKPTDKTEPVGKKEDDTESSSKKTTHKDITIKTGATKTTIRDKELEGGINIYDEFVTDEDKKKLALSKWKNITSAEVRRNSNGEPVVVILKNKFAKLGDRVRKIRKGESGFENGVDFVERVESKIKYV